MLEIFNSLLDQYFVYKNIPLGITQWLRKDSENELNLTDEMYSTLIFTALKCKRKRKIMNNED